MTIVVPQTCRQMLLDHARRKLAGRYDADETPDRQAFGLLGGRRLESTCVVAAEVFPLRRNLRDDAIRGAALDATIRSLARASTTPLSQRGWLADPQEVMAAQDRCDANGMMLFGSYHMHKTRWNEDPLRDTPTVLDAALGEGQGLWMLILSMVDPNRPALRAFWEGRRECEAQVVSPRFSFRGLGQ